MSHFKTVCQKCGVIITQCRCPDENKRITYGTCAECLKPEKPPMTDKSEIEELAKKLFWEQNGSPGRSINFEWEKLDNKKSWLHYANKIIEWGWIPKSRAVEYIKRCEQCASGKVWFINKGSGDCADCNGMGFVMKENP